LAKKKELYKKYNYEFDIVAVNDIRFGTVYNSKGLDINKVLSDVRKKGKFTKSLENWDAIQMIKKSNANVICELAFTNLKDGQPAILHCKTAFKNKKHIVTSNKGRQL
jgi:homoserine dehydrogenase